MKNKTCCFTGHRPGKFPFGYDESDERCIALKKSLQKEIERLIREENTIHFISGLALGVDMWCAEIVLSLKNKYPNITLEAAIPYEEQAASWTEEQRDRYFRIVERCDKETLVQKHYARWCFQKRNKYMVDNADFVIAVWNGEHSGTGNTVKYARRLNKSVILINPNG